MDNTKLNALAAKAMGWVAMPAEIIPGHVSTVWKAPDSTRITIPGDWNPSTCADDALVLLQKATGISGWFASFNRIDTDIFSVSLPSKYPYEPVGANQKTLPLAMTLCALRAAGISETEIQEALK